MKRFNYFLTISFLLIQFNLIAQVENVQLNHPVYTFLKEMNVKGLIDYIYEDDPVLSRFEVIKLLNTIKLNDNSLSNTEKKLLHKFMEELSDEIKIENSTQLFNPRENFLSDLSDVFSQKVKYLYAYKQEGANIFLEGLGHFYHGQRFSPTPTNNANLYDIGFRMRGTVFDKLGYNLTVIKGGVSGNDKIAETIEPKLLSNFKWVENIENIGNYGFNYGYLKFYTEPMKDMNLSVQLGREDITFGYGYGSKLVLSGENPTLDFVKFNFNYGAVHFTSLHASTVGNFSYDITQRYTKYLALNRLKLSFKNLFDFGIGETMVYSERGIELGYLSPLAFYKFIEMDLQDRDNGSLWMDFQTRFLKRLQFQATFYLDENILSNLQDLERYTNKTAYQLNAYWYEAFSIPDLSVIAEYTRIRPFVYTHRNPKNTYTAFGTSLGHRIGPNADEIMVRANYNVSDRIRLTGEFRFSRKGNNVYDENGNLIKNVGGDIFLSHPDIVENKTAKFLDGERVNTSHLILGFRIEPIREFYFDIFFNYISLENLTKSITENFCYGLIKFTLEY
ncbi:MAG: capsule assembly Wzi family protein [Ignavibacterium album]|uniref:capsule assembly Wzi family protein n=1 Tax=Ignavibacterium album TaxID=591197 RepID=UPI0026EECF9C|nr:capsule assembly Wzi family protein [Ignavibacterium album]MCX8104920.1 capsule assembly Wzi family protein [Ignavibacterium album]